MMISSSSVYASYDIKVTFKCVTKMTFSPSEVYLVDFSLCMVVKRIDKIKHKMLFVKFACGGLK